MLNCSHMTRGAIVNRSFGMANRGKMDRNTPSHTRSAHAHADAPLRILVVEDNYITQRMLHDTLQRFGHMVEIADGGSEGLQLLLRREFDVVFMDINLPDINGLKIVQRFREARPDSSAHIVALTVNRYPGAVGEYMSGGFDAYIPKPFLPDQVEMLLESLNQV